MDDEYDECALCGADFDPDDDGASILTENGQVWYCAECAELYHSD